MRGGGRTAYVARRIRDRCDEDLRRAIAAGINVVHINTELRVAWRRGLEEGGAKKPDEVVPYKILPAAVEAVKQVALPSRLRLFNGMGSISEGCNRVRYLYSIK